MILSKKEPQQVDPMGPLLFSHAIHPILESMKSSLIIGYLDDLTAGGDQHTVASDHLMIETKAA